jgi:class 3 adenylate cyclase
VPYPGAASKFAQEILRQQGELYLILPCRADAFKLMMANYYPTDYANWEKVFDQLLSGAKDVVVIGDDFHILNHSIRDYLDRVSFGLSVLKSMELSSAVEVIGRPVVAAQNSDSKVMALVFGDAVNFSKLQHEHFPIFEKEVWGLVENILQEMRLIPALSNTWGDGLYMVMQDLGQAARFSLILAERMASTDWKSKGLPQDIGLRVGIHAGPVFESINPLTKNVSYIGASVCRAARIEPITPAGQVFVSQEFAALVASEHSNKFNFSYVGSLSMAKNYGTFPMYRLEEVRGLR